MQMDLLAPVAPTPRLANVGARTARAWRPKRVVFTPDALEEPHGQAILARAEAAGLDIERLPSNRITGLRGATERETYRLAKQTLAVVNAPAGQFALQPIPPSADFQFHLAQGCPAHCGYCYLAGSLTGPPVVRAYANVPSVLDNTRRFERAGAVTTFEASCYTDPLGIEHLTGSLAAAVEHFATREGASLRWTTKFDAVGPLVGLDHGGRTQARFSVNAAPIERAHEAGTSSVDARLAAARTMAEAGYPVGLVVAPIVFVEGWEGHYADLLDRAALALGDAPGLTFELITHRFTPGSKATLASWYPGSTLDMGEDGRAAKRGKFGALKYVYAPPTMRALRAFFSAEIARRLPAARVLYWT